MHIKNTLDFIISPFNHLLSVISPHPSEKLENKKKKKKKKKKKEQDEQPFPTKVAIRLAVTRIKDGENHREAERE